MHPAKSICHGVEGNKATKLQVRPLKEFEADAEDEMQLIVDQLLDLGKQKTDCKAFVRSLCTMKIIQRMNELDCREAAS